MNAFTRARRRVGSDLRLIKDKVLVLYDHQNLSICFHLIKYECLVKEKDIDIDHRLKLTHFVR